MREDQRAFLELATAHIAADDDEAARLREENARLREENARLRAEVERAASREEALREGELRRESHNLLRAVVEGTTDVIYVKDLEGRMLLANSECGRILGKAPEQLLGEDVHAWFPPEIARTMMAQDREVMAAGQPRTFEETVPTPRGTRTFFTTKGIYRDGHGRVIGLIGISRDITERGRAEEALRESEKRYREVFNCTSDCIFLLDVTPDHRFRFVELNPTEEQAVGFSTSEVAGKLIEEALPEHLARQVAANFRRCVETGALVSYEEELELPTGRKTFQTSLVPVHKDSEGIHRIIGVARDITDDRRKEAQLRASLREKEVLLKEVHHRVKNNLQFVISLLSLQAAQMKDRAVMNAFTENQNRLRAMAMVHENLYRSPDLASVSLAKHVEALCAHVYRSYGVDPDRIALDLRIAPVTLDLDRSLRLGLIVNELVSNAMKHAFPGERAGHVTVQLDASPGGWYTLRVGDDGVGLPPWLSPDRSESLGLQLVHDLTEQLGGTLAVDRAGGTTFTLLFQGDGAADS